LRRSLIFALRCHLELKAGRLEEVLRSIDLEAAGANNFLASLRLEAIAKLLTNPGINEAQRLESQRELAGHAKPEDPRFEDLPR
jgi:hypothetical protein